jgi:hypothetical protein
MQCFPILFDGLIFSDALSEKLSATRLFGFRHAWLNVLEQPANKVLPSFLIVS